LLELNKVQVYYGNVHALKGITISIKEGEIVTLIGANGAGKTTTLMAISGILTPRDGDIKFLGEEIKGKAPGFIVSKGISHVPEGRRIFPYLTVEENLKIGAHLRLDREAIQEDLKKAFDLFPQLKRMKYQMGGSLSGGEQQMLAIARALVAKPKLLLMDEPSMGLAPILVDQVFEIIREINKQGITILLVEQNAYRALNVADRGYVLEVGKITLADSANKLLKNKKVQIAYLGI